MISYAEAQKILFTEFEQLQLEKESVSVLSSLHRTLAADVLADSDFPLFSNSAVDGYAVILSENTRTWNVIDEITAGHFHSALLDKHSAISIMTGAKIPENTTAVLPIEILDRQNNTITIKDSVVLKPGMNIRVQGEDCKKGTVVLSACTQIQTQHLPILLGCGYSTIEVYKQLRFGIVATGDELIPFTEKPVHDKIRATNGETLFQQVLHCNQLATNFGIAHDNEKELCAVVKSMVESENVDIILSTGGVSVGTRDYVQSILLSLGATIHFWRSSIKPGKPILFASLQQKSKRIFFFGLPGNPVSAFLNFKIFVEPVLQKLFHQSRFPTLFAELTAPVKKKDAKRHFVNGIVELDEHNKKYTVRSLQNQSSGNMFGLSHANCFIVMKEEDVELHQGEIVECIPI